MVIPAQTEEDILIRSPDLDRQIDRIGRIFQGLTRDLFRGPSGRRVRNFLNGVWLGHPLHAALTDLPVGAWTVGIACDYLGAIAGNRFLRSSGDLLTGVGIAGATTAAVAGLADYSEIIGEQRRVGTLHALLNGIGLVAYIGSMIQRVKGNRAGAVPLATLGYLSIFAASSLGGTMVFRYGTGVNQQDRAAQGPKEFIPVLAADQLGERQLKLVNAAGFPVLLTKINGEIFAMGNTCTHEGCSLAEGHLVGSHTIHCHCHGSEFNVETGQVVNGPAIYPEPTFDVQINRGQIEVRERPY